MLQSISFAYQKRHSAASSVMTCFPWRRFRCTKALLLQVKSNQMKMETQMPNRVYDE